MSELTDAVEALTSGVIAHGEAIEAAMTRVAEDFEFIQQKLEEAQADDEETRAAVSRINENVSMIQNSSATLTSLDPDPAHPEVPPPPPEPEPQPEPEPSPEPPVEEESNF